MKEMSDMASGGGNFDEEQADLFDRCIELGMNAKQLGYWLDCHERHARRIMDGSSPLMGRHIRLFLRNAEPPMANMMDDYINSGSGRLSVDMDAECGAGVDGELVQSMHQMTDMMQRRLEHASDGVITEDEQAVELELCRRLLRRLHGLHASIKDQRTRRHASALRITTNNTAAGAATTDASRAGA